ncbi:MAG: amino acid ABC transporter permease [Gammaproteobacteria bacterium]|nr:amino acid ABC transporter permease [Gammaproteobacteria bacterium]
MTQATTSSPSWSPERKSTAIILVSAVLLVLILWLIAIPLSWAPDPIGPAAQLFAEGTRTTVELTLLSGIIGVLIGVLVAVGKLSKFLVLRMVSAAYIWIIRGTPLLVQILFVFLALPMLVPELQLSDFNSAAVALAFNVGAYNAEAIRAGIQAIPKGQIEAARSLGLSPLQTFFDVTFPQAFKISLPPLVNNFVALLKDSSLAYVIGVVELSNIGNRIQAATFQPVPVFITTACLYLLLTTVLTQISGAIEDRLDIGRR